MSETSTLPTSRWQHLIQYAVDIGWWEPTTEGRLWPGRIWLRFWRNPKNRVNRSFLHLLLTAQDTNLRAYQKGVEDGRQAKASGPRKESLRPREAIIWN